MIRKVIILIFICSLFLFPIDTTAWRYEKDIHVSYSIDENYSNASVRLVLHTSNFDFNYAQSKGEDIRFVDLDTNEIPHWIEEWSPGEENAVIWLGLTNVSKSASGVTLKMLYGNSDAVSSSEGTNVFLYFEDFDALTNINDSLAFPSMTEISRELYTDPSGIIIFLETFKP
ncbi:DUF2341 domain-containing protein, partial [Spirochaetota bacterium]